VGYIYHWSGSRWILIGGGLNSPTINAGITEPGIYRVGYMLLAKNPRIAGNDGTQTSIRISQYQFSNGTDTVILARSDDYSDALTGVPLAYKLHAPILLTPSARLSVEVFTEIQRLAPKKIILLGGTVALSTAIEQQLQGSYSLQRLGGVTRYDTAALIASTLGTLGQAIIVNGNNYPDAISMASTAAQHGMPILVTDTQTMPEETDTIMRQLLISETIVGGGEAVVAQTIFDSLPNPTRLFGNDRYDTAVAILKAYPPQGRVLFIATGENFPDALSGGVIAAINQTGLVLVPPSGPTPSELSMFKTWHEKNIYVFGGIVAVPETVVQQIQGII
jgi:putative cell wall-binding protein